MKKEFLTEKVNEGLSIRKISDISGKSYTDVRYWLNKYELKTNCRIGRGRTKIEKCLFCNKEISIEKKYCGNKCQQAWLYENITMKNFQEGLIKDHKTLRKLMIVNLDYKCDICKISNWNEKSITLQIDHIDGNYRNNKPTNLRFLCPNCHTQTDNWGIKNLGNGRRLN